MTDKRPSLSERLAAARAQQEAEANSILEARRTAADEMLNKLTLVIGDADEVIATASSPGEIDAALVTMAGKLQDIYPNLTQRTAAPAAPQNETPSTSEPESAPQRPQPATRREAQTPPQTRQEARRQPSTPPPPHRGGKLSEWFGERTGFGPKPGRDTSSNS
jgi:hypothetical protein